MIARDDLHQLWRRRWLTGVVGTGLLIAGVLATRGHRFHDEEKDWLSGRTRRIEPRLEHPRADIYKPYSMPRGDGDGATSLDYEGLAEAQAKGDVKALADRLLVQRAGGLASRALAAAPEDPALDNERAVLALVEDKPGDAVHFIERALARHPQSSPILWNRALALRDLGLGYASTAMFTAVAGRGEPGWSDEARRWATLLKGRTDERRQRYQKAEAQTRLLVAQHLPPSLDVIEQLPEVVRLSFYDAVRTAPSADALDRLLPSARALDARLGIEVFGPLLARARASDFGRRGPLAATYAQLRANRWKEPSPGFLNDYAASLRRAGPAAADLLVGVLLSGRLGPSVRDELLQIGDAERDPWLVVSALQEAARADPDTAVNGGRERLQQRAIARAKQEQLLLKRLELQIDRGNLLLRQQRPILVGPLAHETQSAATQAGLWSVEVKAIAQLAHLSSYLEDASVVKAYSEEVALGGAPCDIQLNVQSRVAERAMNDGRLDDARTAITSLDACAQEASLKLPALSALSELARVDPTGRMLQRFRRELTRFRQTIASAGASSWASDLLSAKGLEGRAIIDSDRQTGRQLLTEVIASAEATGSGSRELALPRLAAYRRLISDHVKTNELPRALELILAEAKLAMPPGCVLGIAEDQRKTSVIARLTDGRYLGSLAQPPVWDDPRAVVPADIRKALGACQEVAVVALSPFRGKARLLGPEVAWRHLVVASPRKAEAWTPTHHVVVSDTVAPASYGLPLLQPWQPSPGSRIDRHLTRAEANPATVTEELQKADLIEFHVHGLADFRVAEAPYLVLSEGKDGQSKLEAEAIRDLTLRQRPFVVLAACNSAASSPYFSSQSGRWSLPAAFLQAGARAVLAANDPIPDEDATAFIDDVVKKAEAGVPAAIALRDVRMKWLSRNSPWIETIVLFE